MYRPHQRLEKRAFLYSAAAIAAVLLLGLLAFWLIPAQEAFIEDIDHDQRLIKFNLPDGLLE